MDRNLTRGGPAPTAGSGACAGGPPRRVCVLGAGASGLTLARELVRLGHEVVVLENTDQVGGKAESVYVDGRAYDMGAHVCTTAYTELYSLAAELGVETEDATPTLELDAGHRRAAPPGSGFFRRRAFQRYLRLREREFPDAGRPGLAHSAAALALPISSWLDAEGLGAMAGSLGTGYTSGGFGLLTDPGLPALYFVKFAELTGLVGSGAPLGGHAGNFTVKDGFARLWRRVAKELPDVRTGVRVEWIERGPDAVTVRTGSEQVTADALVLTVPLDRVRTVMDLTDEERDIASRVRTVDYRTVLCRVSGLPRGGMFLLPWRGAAAATSGGRCVAYHSRYAGQDLVVAYCYGDGVDAGALRERLGEDLARAGGRLEEVLRVAEWPFMPHFGCEDVAAGVLERLEASQGLNRTYHAGSLPAFELIETNVAYARDLAARFFQITERAAGPAPPRAAGPVHADGLYGAEEIRVWLVRRVAAELNQPECEIDPSIPVEAYGLDSLEVADIQADLSERIGFRVPPTLLSEFPTLDAVARHLASAERAEPGGE
ncbi:FAD-dependent oxidoreductase [Sphaerisporangium album]|uniref:FAD-dependent oxidoreductase n=1 Tax=Sphaerisporangium album TaxID=509200 RepID=A0A367FIN4_9ACTN|nr:FAD-dependent oxidoreductase [Sphaerisporangium album]RCG29672.1 FAD-dependent oxidoreductase [Sphaerisporangium album]